MTRDQITSDMDFWVGTSVLGHRLELWFRGPLREVEVICADELLEQLQDFNADPFYGRLMTRPTGYRLLDAMCAHLLRKHYEGRSPWEQ